MGSREWSLLTFSILTPDNYEALKRVQSTGSADLQLSFDVEARRLIVRCRYESEAVLNLHLPTIARLRGPEWNKSADAFLKRRESVVIIFNCPAAGPSGTADSTRRLIYKFRFPAEPEAREALQLLSPFIRMVEEKRPPASVETSGKPNQPPPRFAPPPPTKPLPDDFPDSLASPLPPRSSQPLPPFHSQSSQPFQTPNSQNFPVFQNSQHSLPSQHSQHSLLSQNSTSSQKLLGQMASSQPRPFSQPPPMERNPLNETLEVNVTQVTNVPEGMEEAEEPTATAAVAKAEAETQTEELSLELLLKDPEAIRQMAETFVNAPLFEKIQDEVGKLLGVKKDAKAKKAKAKQQPQPQPQPQSQSQSQPLFQSNPPAQSDHATSLYGLESFDPSRGFTNYALPVAPFPPNPNPNPNASYPNAYWS